MRPWLPRAEHPRRAAVSAFGFGGSNFHAVLEEYGPEKREPDWDGSVEIVALGADTPHELAAKLEKVPTEWNAFARFAEQSRAVVRLVRTLSAAASPRTAASPISRSSSPAAKAKLAANPTASWHTPEGVHYGTGPAAGKLAVLFPGQGSQAVGMLRDLACLFPEMLDSLAGGDDAVAKHGDDPPALRSHLPADHLRP